VATGTACERKHLLNRRDFVFRVGTSPRMGARARATPPTRSTRGRVSPLFRTLPGTYCPQIGYPFKNCCSWLLTSSPTFFNGLLEKDCAKKVFSSKFSSSSLSVGRVLKIGDKAWISKTCKHARFRSRS